MARSKSVRSLFMLLATSGSVAIVVTFVAQAAFATTYVAGSVPDWDQPYTYGPPATAGPGPDPTPFFVDPFNAWCAPTAGSNLLGHWQDHHGETVADGNPFPGTPLYGAPSWHDYNLDAVRPPPAALPPAGATDVAWYMDTNNSGDGVFGNVPHDGTYAQDIHAGLATYLNTISSNWRTGTRGVPLALGGLGALGTDTSGAPATEHPDALSAFTEIVGEINADRTILVQWDHWNVMSSGIFLAGDPAREFFTFGGNPGSDAVWGTDESWEEPVDPKLTLGHVVTAIGYIPAAHPDDPGIHAITGLVGVPFGDPDRIDTDWVIVRDNVPGTPQDVIVPLTSNQFPAPWVANHNAIRDALPVPALGAWAVLALALVLAALTLVRLRDKPYVVDSIKTKG